MNYPTRYLALLTLGLATACQSKEEKANAALVDALEAQAESPAEQARMAAQKAAYALPPARPASAVVVRAGVEQLLPAEGYLELVSVKGQALQPITISLPPMWRIGVKPGYPKVGPGYKIPFEAVLRWKPTGYVETKPKSALLVLQTPKDSLMRFYISEMSVGSKVVQVRPGEPVTVQGVLYTYLDRDNAQRLLVYPYQDKQVYLPLAN
ncbi:hypothetical protein [Hymenobacter koreensis]|uniref:Lipoprotein n=1 Tax=Hymenobacter koreensis TaxID=1084523 RepID=A0ABP8JP15_9BACT